MVDLRETNLRTRSISRVAVVNRASKVPTALAPLSYENLAKVGARPKPMLLMIISATPKAFGFLRTR